MFETGVSGPIEWAVAGQPLPGEDESGDGWVVADTGGATLLGVIDGLGHGHAGRSRGWRQASFGATGKPGRAAERLVRLCHQALSDTRGAAITIAALSIMLKATLEWLGVGNVTGSLVRAHPRALPCGPASCCAEA